MAMSDYYLCDHCQGKALYDADIYDRWDQIGCITIICKTCALTHETGVKPKKAVINE